MGILKLLLAISVIIVHVRNKEGDFLVGGTMAVQLFLVLSGFYMSLIINEKYINNLKSYWLFIRNRLLSIFPYYWVILGLSLVAVFSNYYFHSYYYQIYYYLGHLNQLNILTLLYIFFINIFILGSDLIFFLGINPINGSLFFTKKMLMPFPSVSGFLMIPPTWYLALALYFYLLSPFILKKNIKLIITMIIASLGLRLFLSYKGLYYDPWNYRFFPTELAIFLLGAVSYRIYKKIQNWKIKPHFSILVFLIQASLILVYFRLPGLNIGLGIYLREWIFVLFFTLAIPFIFFLFKNNHTDRFLGELAYPIYLSHFLIVEMLKKTITPLIGYYLEPLSVILSIILSLLLVFFIGKPIKKAKQYVKIL